MKSTVAAEFVLLAALWGASFMFMRFGAAEFGAWAAAGGRVGLAALVLLPLLWRSGQIGMLRQRAGALFVSGMLSSAIPFALYSYAVMSISTGLSSILNATTPLFGALVAWVWLKDRPQMFFAQRLWASSTASPCVCTEKTTAPSLLCQTAHRRSD